jgi:hypothetical protein
MATYKVTIEFKTDQDEEDFRYNILDCIDSCCFDYYEIANLEKVSITPEEAIKQIKELRKEFIRGLPNSKLDKILASID